MKKFVIALLFFACVPFALGIRINEVFPNPPGDDNNKEYIEIFHEEFVNLTGYIIGDEASNDTLTAFQYVNSSYSLIVEEGFDYAGINTSVYNSGATIGNNLGNSADSIYFFFPNRTLIGSVSYTAIDEGKSYEYYAGEWHIAENKTPGFENNIYLNNTIQSIVDKTINDFVDEKTNTTANITADTNTTTHTITTIKSNTATNTNITTNMTGNQTIHPTNILKISSLLPNMSYINQTLTKGFRIDHLSKGKINALLTYIIYSNQTVLKNQTIILEDISRYRTKNTIEFTFAFAGNYTVCGFVDGSGEEDYSDNSICSNITIIDYTQVKCDRALNIKTNQTIFQNKKQVSYEFVVEGDNQEIPFTVSYFIQEFSGEIVKEMQNTSTDSTKHWTPHIEKEYGLYTIYAELIETGCNDTLLSNNNAKKEIIVKNTYDEEGSISIEHVYMGTDGIARTGDIVRIKVRAYTGNLSRLTNEKKGIKAYMTDDNDKKVSDVFVFSIAKSFQELEWILPLFLEYSCSEFPISEKHYAAVIEGLGMTAKQKFPVQGVNKEKCSSSSQGEYQNILFTTTAHILENITANITIHNIDDTMHLYKVSSKIYRGPKTYSGDFFENQKQTELLPGEEKEISLNNWVPELEPGTYKVKIYVQKDEQKTLKQFTHDIEIQGEEQKEKNTAQIISFTSLSTEPKKEITLLAHINSTGNYTLVLDTIIDKQEKEVEQGISIITFNTTLLKGKNVFVINLIQHNNIIDTQSLIMHADDNEINYSRNTTAMNTKPLFHAITGNVVLKPAAGLQERYDSALFWIYVFIGIVVCIGMYIIHRKKHNLFKTTTLSLDYEEQHQSTRNY